MTSSPPASPPLPLTLRPDDPRFPAALRIVHPPVKVLYALGDLAVLDQPMVAIVGSREPSRYGIKVAYEAGREAARAGLVVVSGMARGLDARAHRGALDGGGKTVGVLGCGFGVAYPKQNVDLLETIPRCGLLLSELPPGERPTPWSFPARNRLIAALGQCLLVVEGRAKGGTSNTVEWMNHVGRTVLAVPGRIDEPLAEGPNVLIQQGATPYLSPRDLLGQFGLAWSGAAGDAGASDALTGPRGAPQARREPSSRRLPVTDAAQAPLDDDVLDALDSLATAEAQLFDVITPEPMHVDRLAERAGLAASALLAALSSLELKGLVLQEPGKRFRLAS